MILAIVAGIIIGFILALPPGPIGVTVMRVTLDKGISPAAKISLGTSFMDFFYCLVVIFATSAVIGLADRFAHDYPLLILIFQFAVVIGLLVFGFINLRHKNDKLDEEGILKKKNNKVYDYLSHKGPFFFGIAIAFTTIANPTFLPTLAYVSMYAQKLGFTDSSVISNILFAIGFGIGNFLWLYLVIKVLFHFKSRMSDQFLVKIHAFAGVTLIGVGTILGYKIIEITKWSEIIRLIFAF